MRQYWHAHSARRPETHFSAFRAAPQHRSSAAPSRTRARIVSHLADHILQHLQNGEGLLQTVGEEQFRGPETGGSQEFKTELRYEKIVSSYRWGRCCQDEGLPPTARRLWNLEEISQWRAESGPSLPIIRNWWDDRGVPLGQR